MSKYLFIVVLFIVGCGGEKPTKSNTNEIPLISETTYGSKSAAHLPTNARNVKEIGNGWITFDLEVEGKEHSFLFARYKGAYGAVTGTITEIQK